MREPIQARFARFYRQSADNELFEMLADGTILAIFGLVINNPKLGIPVLLLIVIVGFSMVSHPSTSSYVSQTQPEVVTPESPEVLARQILVQNIAQHPTFKINPDAALYIRGMEVGLGGPKTDEITFTLGGRQFKAQAFDGAYLFTEQGHWAPEDIHYVKW